MVIYVVTGLARLFPDGASDSEVLLASDEVLPASEDITAS